MKKDIKIPPVDHLFLAITEEYNEALKVTDHYAYLINEMDEDLEMVLILSSGSDANRVTSTMRHKIENLPSKSYARVELIQEDVLKLRNEFKVTFFKGDRLFEKNFALDEMTWKKNDLRHINTLGKTGILLK